MNGMKVIVRNVNKGVVYVRMGLEIVLSDRTVGGGSVCRRVSGKIRNSPEGVAIVPSKAQDVRYTIYVSDKGIKGMQSSRVPTSRLNVSHDSVGEAKIASI